MADKIRLESLKVSAAMDASAYAAGAAQKTAADKAMIDSGNKVATVEGVNRAERRRQERDARRKARAAMPGPTMMQ